MKTHTGLDKRALALAQAVASKIDADPTRAGLLHARQVLDRWLAKSSYAPDLELWRPILQRSWVQARKTLLDTSELGTRLRQSSPFTGILSTGERTQIIRRFARS